MSLSSHSLSVTSSTTCSGDTPNSRAIAVVCSAIPSRNNCRNETFTLSFSPAKRNLFGQRAESETQHPGSDDIDEVALLGDRDKGGGHQLRLEGTAEPSEEFEPLQAAVVQANDGLKVGLQRVFVERLFELSRDDAALDGSSSLALAVHNAAVAPEPLRLVHSFECVRGREVERSLARHPTGETGRER